MLNPNVWDPETYDAPRRRLVPDYDAFYDTAAMLVASTGQESPSVLDLGAGTGLLSQTITHRVKYPRLTLLDRSQPLLEIAAVRLQHLRPELQVASLEDGIPPGPFDIVMSGLSIHHLPHESKRKLFADIRMVLKPGGLFVNADQVAGATPWHDRFNRQMHEAQARSLGTTDEEWDAAVERMRCDIYATVEDHLRWLADAGFERGDCFFKRFGFAVIAAWRPS